MKTSGPHKVIISGGGTGGHIYPAIAIAKAMEAMDPDIRILFVGAKGRMEMEKVPRAGYKILGLWISGFQRRLTRENLKFPFKVLSSLCASRNILKRFKPDIAIGVGGYASGPLLYMANRRGLPTLIQEQNSFAGITNKLLANKADRICVAYEGMEKYFPKDRIRFTGNPVRKDIEHVDHLRQEACGHFGLDPEKRTLLVTGGSLGARTINESVAEGLDKIIAKGYQVLWQTGERYYQVAAEKMEEVQSPLVKVHKFIYRMDYAYAVADTVVSRAGALAVSELSIVQRPVILVPSPNVAEDHQRKNAMALEDKKAAVMVQDFEAHEQLVDEVIALMDDPDKQQRLRENIKQFARPEAAREIAREAFELMGVQIENPKNAETT